MNKIIVCLLLIVSPFLLISQNSKNGIKIQTRQHKVKYTQVKDSAFYSVLNKVLQFEKMSKYYSPSTFYSILIYKKENKNIIKIEGTDNLGLFVESKDLQGCFKYKSHYFFLLTRCDELFIDQKRTTTFKIKKLFNIIEDDRWPIYYFGYDDDNFIFYDKTNYTPK